MKKHLKLVAVFSVCLMFMLVFVKASYAGDLLPATSPIFKNSLSKDELSFLEERESQAKDLLSIKSGEGTDPLVIVFAAVGLLVLIGAIVVASQSDDDD